jgi:RNA polymerase sigma-70 factor (ECF subfamily)
MTHPELAIKSRSAGNQGLPMPLISIVAEAGDLVLLRKRLLRHARLAVHDRCLAENLVRDTLLVVTQQRARYRGDATLLTWSIAILRNKVADWYRSPDRRRMARTDMADGLPAGAVETPHAGAAADPDPAPAWQQPERQEEQRQMMSVLERCIACLSPMIGRVFVMREWLGYETYEIVERLQISEANCRTMLHRARLALRACMQRDWLGK